MSRTKFLVMKLFLHCWYSEDLKFPAGVHLAMNRFLKVNRVSRRRGTKVIKDVFLQRCIDNIVREAWKCKKFKHIAHKYLFADGDIDLTKRVDRDRYRIYLSRRTD